MEIRRVGEMQNKVAGRGEVATSTPVAVESFVVVERRLGALGSWVVEFGRGRGCGIRCGSIVEVDSCGVAYMDSLPATQ